MDDAPRQRFETLFGPEFGHGKPFDLSKLRKVLGALDDPHKSLPSIIHVAGTNGKGSTIAFMRAIAEAAGLRAHAFTKPHLLRLNERFLVSGEPASNTQLIAAAERVAAISRDLTQFDAQVTAAFLLFGEIPADLVLLETGMGGRDDSTNVIESPAATLITPIGLDHQDALGATLLVIAAHKAGILKPGAPVFASRQAPDVMRLIENAAETHTAPLFRQGVEWDAYMSHGRFVVQTRTRVLDLPAPSLIGAHQLDNAGLACATLLELTQFAVADSAFATGVAHAHWPGRLQPLTRGPLATRAGDAELWLDGGHNAHAAAMLARALSDLNRKRPARTALIIGMRARKDWLNFVETLAPCAEVVIATTLPDGANPAAIAALAGANAQTAPDLSAAVDAARALGAERILICGSLSLAALALA